jgi:choice-of-anchor B domain-containing protein
MAFRRFRGPRRAALGTTGGRLAIVGLFVALALLPTAAAGREGPVRYDPGSAGGAPAPGDLSLVGSLALPGFNADIWGHKGFAYIGSWGTSSNYPARCPATGVRIIDLADPAHPALVGAIATIAGTSQEDIYVASVATPAFTGDLLVTGIQACNRASNAQRGVDLWDVTNPRAPQHLAFWSSGPGGSGAQGGHELDLVVRGDHVYMGVAVPYSESLEHRGDFRMVDVTDPRNPVELSAWGATIDGGINPAGGQTFFGHSARFNAVGTMVVVSYWDAGAILLDVTDPAHPSMIGRTPYPAGAPVADHSTWFAADETLLLSADEYGGPQAGRWGGLRIWDIHDPHNPVQIAEYLTPDASSGRPGGAFQYTIHNPIVRGTTAYLSWYADGVRVLDIADPRAPREIGSFVPPSSADPYGYFPTSAMVWGVYSDDDLVLLSDINGGLYVLRTPFSGPQCFSETGHCIQGRFLDYWQGHGGLAINGYPISDELTETLEDGHSYTVQYFERTRLEYHPDSPPQYQVQLGQFGRRIHPADPPATARGDATYFNETGHNLGGRFLDFWQAHGGLAQFGYPLTEEFTETLEDGKPYTVQYFERARF